MFELIGQATFWFVIVTTVFVCVQMFLFILSRLCREGQRKVVPKKTCIVVTYRRGEDKERVAMHQGWNEHQKKMMEDLLDPRLGYRVENCGNIGSGKLSHA